MKKRPADTLATQIAKALADRIITGVIQPDSPLRQNHIAREFGASHVPVREAFRQLEAQGLAVNEPRRGVRVTAYDIDEIHEVAAMRATLETLALRHAARHITPAVLVAAEQANLMTEGARDVREWEIANRQFHRLIVTPCRMPRLLSTIDALHIASARFLFAAWRSYWEKPTDRDHTAIRSALRRGQTDIACSVLSKHVQRTGRSNLRKFPISTMGYAIIG